MARKDPKLGILVPLRGDPLALIGVGTFNSSYTQAGQGPGVAVGATGNESWRPIVTGEQSTPGGLGIGVGVRSVKGGYPSRGSGATFIVRVAGSTDPNDWQGWSEPNLVTGWSSPSDYQAQNWTIFAAARRSDTGEIVVAGLVSGDTQGRSWSYNPRTEAWTTRFDFAANAVPLFEPLTMAEDPDKVGRMILWSGDDTAGENTLAYYSDDSGATWNIYAVGTHNPLSGSLTRSSVGVHASRDWLLIHGTRQYASSDRGVNWIEVESISAHLTGSVHSVALGPRGYVVAYVRDTDSFAAVRVLPTGFSPFSAAAEVVLVAEAVENVLVAADDDGILYAYTWHSADLGFVRCFRSLNGGFTWGAYFNEVAGRVSVDHGRLLADVAVFSLGRCHLFGDISGSANALACMILGGWSKVDQGNSFDGTSAISQGRFGWSDEALPSEQFVYVPADVPGNSGFTVAGAGSEALSGGGLTTTVVAQTRNYSWILQAGTANNYMCGHWAGFTVSGPLRSSAAAWRISAFLMPTTTTAYQLRISIGSDGFRAESFGVGGTFVDVSITTTAPFEIRWQMRQSGGAGAATVWYRIIGQGPHGWVRAVNEMTLGTAAAATDNKVDLGVFSAGTSVVTTLLHAAALDADWRYGIDDLADLGTTPASGVRGIVVGKSLSPAGARYPVPQLNPTLNQVGYVHGIRGPVYRGEEFEVPPGFEFGIANADPLREPSPVVGWRAIDTALQKIVFDAGSSMERWRGGALALVALRASFRTATLSIDDGAGGWTVLGTLDKGFAIQYTRTGTLVVPATSAVINRYFHEDELVGGYLVLATSGTSVARRIVANSAGYWAVGETPALRITVTGLSGTELGSGTGELVTPDGVLVVYPSTEPARRYLRIEVAASQIVPPDGGDDGATSAYSAGKLFAARVIGVGLDPTWSVQGTYQLPSSITRARDGSPLLTRTGPARRAVGYQWSPAPTYPMRDRLAPRNYIGASGGSPIGAEGDPWSVVPRVIDGLDGSPLVLVPRLPTAAATLTDPTTFLYGLATAPSLSITQSGGREGTNEDVAVGGLQVEEIT